MAGKRLPNCFLSSHAKNCFCRVEKEKVRLWLVEIGAMHVGWKNRLNHQYQKILSPPALRNIFHNILMRLANNYLASNNLDTRKAGLWECEFDIRLSDHLRMMSLCASNLMFCPWPCHFFGCAVILLRKQVACRLQEVAHVIAYIIHAGHLEFSLVIVQFAWCRM